ncbi:MAG: alpha-glucan family phosphorylase [Candidatus Omnitrophica bacterium]|nr:alpha-glucan family phosphorylase [Candidatus Omnitrophota bacterium]
MLDIDRTLRKIVSNLWFEWNADCHLLFRSVSPYVWGLFRRNLYRFLKIQDENPYLYRRRLAELLVDKGFLNLCEKVDQSFKSYIQPAETLISRNYPDLVGRTVAYFSMEYGIDILKTYSGGLGILSGDHLRGSSDIGLKMVGIGLFYLHGYYEQEVMSDGTMNVIYESVLPPRKPVRDFLPLEMAKRAGTNEDLVVEVPMKDRTVKARVWRARMGRNDLLLLDSNLRENRVHDRHITRRLYASQKHHEEERRRRLEQEMLLGVGGVRALEEAGYEPSVYHLNEGHVAFAAIEVMRLLMRKHSISFEVARAKSAQIIGFTTHTPVPEGNERFEEKLARDYLGSYLSSFLRQEEQEVIFNSARNRERMFDMTKLALLLAGSFRNGVSLSHGDVCRRMWGYAWANSDPEGKGVPIGSITNAVHLPYWQKPLLRQMIEARGGLEHVSEIEDEKIWFLHLEFKAKLIEKVRERLADQLLREKVDSQLIYERTHDLLDLDSFMIGFARRFADYKRVTMFLEDQERLFQFLERSFKKYGKPIHILYAGKPHPNNLAGIKRIQEIFQISGRLAERSKERGFRSQLVFIQNYDIDLARYLTAGVDIWLNNPIRPYEASGTSGMKAGMNGVLNVSVPDGWVPEGIRHGINGWLFGKGDAHSADQDRDELFKLLEGTILPLYFDRGAQRKSSSRTANHAMKGDSANGSAYSSKWAVMMKESIRTIAHQFNTDRMLTEYIEKMYLPALRSGVENSVLSKRARVV